jgi:arylsulfatase A-like enzyme
MEKRNMTRILNWFVALVVVLGIAADAIGAERPNILVIVADDLGWADVGFHGSKIPTPNLDRLAREGVVLDQHYVAPLCTPTRAAFLSGRYWSRFGNTAPSNTQVFRFGTVTLATALGSVGYETAITGKWHLGSLPEWGPRKFGFDHSYGALAGGTGPWNHNYKKGPYTLAWHRNDERIEEEGHVTDLLTAEALRFLETKRDKPFFLYVPFTAVHHPLDEPQAWLERGAKADPERPQYAACTMHLDDSVGRLLDALERTGQRDKTLIVFFSDNGGMPPGSADRDNGNYPGEYPKGELLGRNTPLRGYKTQLYEGGIRVVAMANWRGTLEPRKETAPLHVVDWMPTLSRLGGFEPKDELKWDGKDVWPIVAGTAREIPSRVLYWEGPGHRSAALRDGDWKLVVHRANAGDKTELFNLSEDPHEEHDLAGEHEDRLARMQLLLVQQSQRDNDAVVKTE